MADSDLYAALIGATPSSAEKQAAIADLLRRNAAFSSVAQMTGDPVLAAQGQNQGAQTQQQAQLLGRNAQANRELDFQRQQESRVDANQQAVLAEQRRNNDMDYRAALAQTMAYLKANEDKAAGGGKPTEGQLSARGYLSRMDAAEKLIGTTVPTLSDTYANKVPLVGNFLVTPEGQKYHQAASDWVRAKLRKESGAAIGKDEMEQEIRTYFPQPGDSKEVIEQKAAARQEAVKEMSIMGNTALPSASAAPPAASDRRTINGKAYSKRGGKWYAD